MNKRVISILMCILMAVVAVGCSQPAAEPAATEPPAPAAETPVAPAEPAAEEPESAFDYEQAGPVLKTVYDTGKLVASVSGNNPPKVFNVVGDGGKIRDEGFEVNMLRGFCEELSTLMGKEISLEIMAVDGAASNLAALQGEKSQIGVSLAPTEERLKSWDFSSTYFKSLKVIVHLRDTEGDPKWDFENGLKGITIGGVLGSTDSECCAEQYPECTMVDYNGYGDILLAGLTGKVDAILCTEPNAILYCSANPELMIEEAFSFESPDDKDRGACIAFAYGNDDFKELINIYIAQIKADGTFDGYYSDALELLNVPEMFEQYKKMNILKD